MNFPWGSLLRAVGTGDQAILSDLRRICAPNALLSVVLSLDLEKDQSEMDRLGLPRLSVDAVNHELAAKYSQAGFQIVETETLSPSALRGLQTSWARRLEVSSSRSFMQIVARALDDEVSTTSR